MFGRQSGSALFVVFRLIWRGPRVFLRRLWTAVYSRAIAQCGRDTVFASGVYIDRPRQIIIGKNCYIGQNVRMGSELRSAQCVIADDVQISEGCTIDYTGGLQIGRRTLLSSGVTILSHDHGYDPHSRPVPVPLEIGDDVWIGTNALILPGTKQIGQGAIVGAGAVVTRPVPDSAIVVGNPARVVKIRHTEE